MNKSLSSAALTWYKYVGPKFAVSNANRREQITEGTVVGIRPIARSEDYYLALKSEPEKMFRINSKRARVIAQKSKAVRVMIGKPELTKEAKDVVDAATGSRLNAERFKPLVPPRNELKTDGVKTSNYQWRVVKDTTLEVDTNKSGRTLTLKRGDIFGLRFVLPTQGGKFVMLDGTYETIPTSQYDSLVQQTPLLPHARWPDTVLSPELIQEYRDRMQRQRISARHEREREERAQDAAVNNARKEAERKAKDQERVVRVNDGKENTQIAKMVTDAARAEAARIQANLEERRRNAGLKDEDLRRMKSADGKTRFSDALDAADSTDDDFGTDLEDNIENSAQRGLPVPAADTKKKLETLSHQLADLYNQVQNAYRKKIRDKDKLSQMLTDIRAQYVEDVPKMRAGDEGIIQAWEEMLSKAEDFVEKKPAPTEPAKKKPEVDPNDVDADLEEEQADDTEEAADEEDPDANDVDSDLEEEDPDADAESDEEEVDEEVDPDADAESDDEEVDPDAEDEDGFEEEEDDADTEDTDAADDEETANDEESDEEVDESEGEEESDDESDGESEENSDDEEVDEDFDPAEMAAEEDSDGISRELAGGEVDEEADDLSDVDEEEDVPPAPVKKTKPKVKEKEPEPKEDAGNEDEEEEIAEDTDSEEPSDEGVESDDENIDDVDEDTQSDENADDDLPQAAGIKTGNVDSDEGDIIVFHDDTKQKRKFAIIQITPNEKDDRILEYTVWDIDNKPESYKVVRINTGRKQHITDMADKVGQMPPKQFNQVADQVADYEYDKSPIKS